MRSRNFTLLLALAAASVAVAQNGSATPSAGTLMVGDKAPPLKVAKWVKGQPTVGFELGKVYVVEFWATWCGPCRTSIPHLTELQKDYGNRVSFNGIAVWQREPADKYLASVTDFVKTMGPKMEYNVAADTSPSNGAMAKGWMTASGQNGIPTAFVVGKDARIAWIGHPMDPEFPKTLDAVLNDTFDAVAAKANARRKAEAATAMQKTMTAVTAAYKKGDDAAADAAMKSLVARYPDTAGMVLNIRFNRAIEKGNETGAHALLREGWSAADLDVDDLNDFAWTLVTDSRIENRDYPLAIAIATRGVELSEEKNAPVIDTLAYALFYGGKVAEAIAWEQKAVDLTGGKDAAMVEALAKYKKAKD